MSSAPAVPYLPLLEPGDHLTRAEFERRYEASPSLKKAELVEGIVHVPSPVKEVHAIPDGLYITWLTVYAARTPGVRAIPNATVRLDGDNEPQPDSLLYIPGRGASVDAEGYLAGAPELIVEVANSTASYDLHEKKRAYERNGVGTYVVHLVRDAEVLWFERVGGVYTRATPDADGCLRSATFPGLWLDAEAALRGDVAGVLDVLARGLSTEDHAAFVAQLALVGVSAAGPPPRSPS